MKVRPVRLSIRAERQLVAIERYIAGQGAPLAGRAFAKRVLDHLLSFDFAPERGRSLPNGTRQIGYDRVLTICWRVHADYVRIIGLYYRGRNLPGVPP